jgi:predicted NBD/HSP70 family sugar kinase
MVEPENISSTIGIAVSSAQIRSVTIDQHETVVASRVFEIGADKSLAEQIKDIVAKTDDAINAIGIAVPGMVDIRTSRIVDSRIPGLTEVDLLAEVRGLTAGDLIIENDVNAAAFAELKIGAGRGRKNMFYVILGEGVGSGLILDGEIWRGSHGYAGEFGLIVVDEEGSRLEEVASAPKIVRRTRNRLHQDSTSILSREGEDAVELDNILAAAGEEDDLARLMLERTGFYVGSAIGVVINILDVGLIVIGGEVTKGGGIILDAIIQRAKECASHHSFEATDIVVSTLGDDASAIGVALLARGS